MRLDVAGEQAYLTGLPRRLRGEASEPGMITAQEHAELRMMPALAAIVGGRILFGAGWNFRGFAGLEGAVTR